jgi:LEA14-like dessication related protein
MKHLTLLLFSLLFLSSCTLTSEPDFVKLNDYKKMQLNKKKLELSTNAYFHNPNDVGCEVVKTEVKLLVNGLHVSDVNQSKVIELDADNEFYIPMNVSIPLEKISKDKSGILGGLITTLVDKNLTISYEGYVRLRKAGIEFDIEIVGEELLKEFKKR